MRDSLLYQMLTAPDNDKTTFLRDFPNNTPFMFVCDDKGGTGINRTTVYTKWDEQIFSVPLTDEKGYKTFNYLYWQVREVRRGTY